MATNQPFYPLISCHGYPDFLGTLYLRFQYVPEKIVEPECPGWVNNGSQPRPRKRLLSWEERKSISGDWTSETSQKRPYLLPK